MHSNLIKIVYTVKILIFCFCVHRQKKKWHKIWETFFPWAFGWDHTKMGKDA